MKQEIEIEYKQLLSEVEYEKIKEVILKGEHKVINHENFYFETKNKDLKANHQALRIRVAKDYFELCLKTQRESDILEKNIELTEDEFVSICNDNLLIYNYLDNLPQGLELLGSLETCRLETKIADGLICLDKSRYGNKEDYEIEFEANDYNKEDILIAYLKKFGVKYKLNKKSKIQRFSEELGL